MGEVRWLDLGVIAAYMAALVSLGSLGCGGGTVTVAAAPPPPAPAPP